MLDVIVNNFQPDRIWNQPGQTFNSAKQRQTDDRQTEDKYASQTVIQWVHSFAFHSVQFPASMTAAPTFRAMPCENTLTATPTLVPH